MSKYLCYDDYSDEKEIVDTEQEAIDWCEKALDEYRCDQEIPYEVCDGAVGYVQMLGVCR